MPSVVSTTALIVATYDSAARQFHQHNVADFVSFTQDFPY
jgi:hypothetical protein